MHHTNNHRAKHAVYKASRSFGSLLKCPSLLILPSILKNVMSGNSRRPKHWRSLYFITQEVESFRRRQRLIIFINYDLEYKKHLISFQFIFKNSLHLLLEFSPFCFRGFNHTKFYCLGFICNSNNYKIKYQ